MAILAYTLRRRPPLDGNVGSLSLEFSGDTQRNRRIGLLFTFAELLTNVLVWIVLWKAIQGVVVVLLLALLGVKWLVLRVGAPVNTSRATLVLYAVCNCVVFLPVPRPLGWQYSRTGNVLAAATPVRTPAASDMPVEDPSLSQLSRSGPGDVRRVDSPPATGSADGIVQAAAYDADSDLNSGQPQPRAGQPAEPSRPTGSPSQAQAVRVNASNMDKDSPGEKVTVVADVQVAGNAAVTAIGANKPQAKSPPLSTRAGAAALVNVTFPRPLSACLRALRIEHTVARAVLAVAQNRFLWLLSLWLTTPGLWAVAWLIAFAATPCPTPTYISVVASSLEAGSGTGLGSVTGSTALVYLPVLGSCGEIMVGVCGQGTCYGRFPRSLVALCCVCMVVAFASFMYLAKYAFVLVRHGVHDSYTSVYVHTSRVGLQVGC